MDIALLKDYIIKNNKYIELILEEAGFSKVRDNGKDYRCAKDDISNPTSISVNKESLFSKCYSTNIKGDLITIVQDKINKSFPETIKWICDLIGFECEDVKRKEIRLPFGGYYKKIKNNKYYNDNIVEMYDESILLDLEIRPNRMFIEDGISVQTQYKYNIGYDSLSGRIVIPWYNTTGDKILGITGRINTVDIEEGVAKYLPIIPFSKGKTLYGLSYNYKNIIEKDCLILGEAEKYCMKSDEFDITNTAALGGCNITDYQANIIKSLRVSTIILAFDESLDEEIVIENAKKIKSDNIFYKNNVGYIYDEHNLYMPKGSKMSPVDGDIDLFKNLITKCVKWI